MKHVVVTIDGPAGTGKSTVAKNVAERLGFTYLDTGALYRAAATAVEDAGADPKDESICAEVMSRTHIEMHGKSVTVNGTDVTERIRTNRISDLASKIAVHQSVRKALLELQRSFRKDRSLVAEGRDTGSVVFPDADFKFYLDASREERARRRHRELASKGIEIAYERILQEINERDERDTSRNTAPLVIPQHAIVVDTTHLDSERVTAKVLTRIREQLTD